MNQCWKFPRVRLSKADNFGGGPGTFCWFFFNFMFMICNSRHEDLQLFIPPLKRSWKGVYWYHLVRLPDCGQNRVRSVSSRILIGSISYSHILSSNFRRCVACNARFKIQKFEIFAIFFKICNFDFVFLWLGIQYDSMVWVIMRRRGYPQNAGVLVVLLWLSFKHCYELKEYRLNF